MSGCCGLHLPAHDLADAVRGGVAAGHRAAAKLRPAGARRCCRRRRAAGGRAGPALPDRRPVERREIVVDLGESRLTGTVARPVRRSPGPGQLLQPLGQAPAAGLAGAAGAHRHRSGPRRGAPSPSGARRPVGARAGRAAAGRPRCWPTCSSCGRPGCASRSRSRRRRRPSTPGSGSTTEPWPRTRRCWTRTWDRERDETYERFFGAGVTLDGLMAAESVASEERGDLARTEPVRHPGPTGLPAAAHGRGVVMSGDPTPFDVCGPLPTGTTVLEASAGTGKTYTIAALAARYVAEGQRRAGPADAGHLRPDGHQRAAAAGPGAAGRRGGRPWPTPSTGAAEPRADWASNTCSPTAPPDELVRRRRPGRPRPGRLRRGHHRHHPRVLPADARRPRRARRPRAAGRLRRAPGRPDPRGGHRPLPAPVRGQRGSRRWRTTRRSDVGEQAVQAVHARLVPDGLDRSPVDRSDGGRAGRVRRGGPRRGRAAQAAPAGCSPTTTC